MGLYDFSELVSAMSKFSDEHSTPVPLARAVAETARDLVSARPESGRGSVASDVDALARIVAACIRLAASEHGEVTQDPNPCTSELATLQTGLNGGIFTALLRDVLEPLLLEPRTSPSQCFTLQGIGRMSSAYERFPLPRRGDPDRLQKVLLALDMQVVC